MFRIVCPQCSNNNDFNDIAMKPEECPHCFNTFEDNIEITEIGTLQKGSVSGLKLIFQNTAEEILIELPHCILGRENTGNLVFKKILCAGNPVISRKHASLTLINDVYWLKDEDSFNGTFIGPDKKECKTAPLPVENGTLVYFGREAFVAQYIYQTRDKVEQIETKTTEEVEMPEEKPKKYRCNQGCGYETEAYADMCPKCYTFDSLVAIK